MQTDQYHGDEMLCNEDCGVCENCQILADERIESYYDTFDIELLPLFFD